MLEVSNQKTFGGYEERVSLYKINFPMIELGVIALFPNVYLKDILLDCTYYCAAVVVSPWQL